MYQKYVNRARHEPPLIVAYVQFCSLEAEISELIAIDLSIAVDHSEYDAEVTNQLFVETGYLSYDRRVSEEPS